MNAVDTNILIYAHDPRDTCKQGIASALIANLDDVVLLWQVACEYQWVARKLNDVGFSPAAAAKNIAVLRTVWTPAVPSWKTYDHAQSLMAGHSLSWWDALIIAACVEAGVDQLYSEDLADGLQVGPVRVINPFL